MCVSESEKEKSRNSKAKMNAAAISIRMARRTKEASERVCECAESEIENRIDQ